MAKGITIEKSRDFSGNEIFLVRKSRGKLTVAEVTEVLQQNRECEGHFAIVLNISDSAMGGTGWGDDEPQKGDVVELYEVASDDYCPLCSKLIPPDYCEECGASFKKN